MRSKVPTATKPARPILARQCIPTLRSLRNFALRRRHKSWANSSEVGIPRSGIGNLSKSKPAWRTSSASRVSSSSRTRVEESIDNCTLTKTEADDRVEHSEAARMLLMATNIRCAGNHMTGNHMFASQRHNPTGATAACCHRLATDRPRGVRSIANALALRPVLYPIQTQGRAVVRCRC
jgi:hypothetical protein